MSLLFGLEKDANEKVMIVSLYEFILFHVGSSIRPPQTGHSGYQPSLYEIGTTSHVGVNLE